MRSDGASLSIRKMTSGVTGHPGAKVWLGSLDVAHTHMVDLIAIRVFNYQSKPGDVIVGNVNLGK